MYLLGWLVQAGDEVVYLREGHAQFLANTNDKRQPPWQGLARVGGALRAAEPCRVVAVDCVISDDGHDYTLARLTLALVDERTPLRVGLYCTHVLHAMHMYCLHVHSSCGGQR